MPEPTDSLAELTREEVRTEPPKRWRNWWRIKPRWFAFEIEVNCGDCGAALPAARGLIATHCKSYPSKDVAETRAREEWARYSWLSRRFIKRLGAFPEGETP